MTFLDHISAWPKWVAAVVSVLSIGLVSMGDYLTGEGINFSIFYLFPISLSTWRYGRRVGVFFCVCCVAAWGILDLSSSTTFHGWPIEIWNTCVRFAFFLVICYDAAALNDALQKERRLSRLDGLTWLANNRHFLERLEEEVERSRRYGHPFSLVYLDLDNFKAVNDQFGHAVGDRLLQEVARCLTDGLRHTDLAGRLGGDEFAVLLPETSDVDGKMIMQRIGSALTRVASVNDWPVGFSAGLVYFTSPVADAETAIRAADNLMYNVKQRGKNDVATAVYADPAA